MRIHFRYLLRDKHRFTYEFYEKQFFARRGSSLYKSFVFYFFVISLFAEIPLKLYYLTEATK